MLKEALEQLEREKRDAFRAAEERLGRAVDRVDEALVRLGVERGELRADLERRISNAIEQLSTEVGERLGRAEVRLEEHARRIGAADRAPDEERRDIEEAVGKVRASIEDASEAVARAADLEARMAAAVRREADAAQRIAEAERRIQGLVENSPPPGE
jgi:chromosome segregation ATPase